METNVQRLSRDMEASFKQLTEYLMKTEAQIEERFNKIETDMADVKTTLQQHTVLLIQILERLPSR